jgi:hypothetical protein
MLIGEVEAIVPDVEPPSKEVITNMLVAGLQKDKQDLLAETHMKVQVIEEKIQQLLCITNQNPINPDDDIPF